LIASKPVDEDAGKATATSSGGGGGGLFGMIGRGIGLSGPAPATEVDQWFEMKASYLTSLQNELALVLRSSSAVISKHAGILDGTVY
jgi:hypothetical protein